jgi:hypothetical protein
MYDMTSANSAASYRKQDNEKGHDEEDNEITT